MKVRTNEFAARLRELMAQRDTGVRDLARKVPCDKAYISRIANGTARPSHRIVARLDKLLGANGELVALTSSDANASVLPAGAVVPQPPGQLVAAGLGQDASLPVWSDSHRPSGEEEQDPVRRRMFHRLAGAGLMSVVLAEWGKHEKAFELLRAAAQFAPQELSARPSAHRLLRDLIHASPPRLQKRVGAFSAGLGVQL